MLENVNSKIRILIVEDDKFALENIVLSLEPEGYLLDTAVSAYQAEKFIEKYSYDILITDVKLPGMDGITFAEICKNKFPDIKIIVITGFADEAAVIKALKIGVNEFLKKPYREKEMTISVSKLIHLRNLELENRAMKEKLAKENIYLKKEIAKQSQINNSIVVGESEVIKKCLLQADKVAQYKINALIRGESGTGKEVFAQYIHKTGHRSDKPFVAVNCAAVSPSLFEAEMFGYEKGAFTGAMEPHAGLFEIADGGIIFLDELTEIPASMQAKLLRVLEQQAVMRVGSSKTMNIDVQVLAATNRDVNTAIKDGVLRLDLYHRIALVEINIPPLRQRNGDIKLLVEYFTELYNNQFNVVAPELPGNIISDLLKQKWEGNVRQLSNFVKKWCLFGKDVTLDEVKAWYTNKEFSYQEHELNTEMRFDFIDGTYEELIRAKQMLVSKIISKYNGNKSRAASHLGLSYPGLLKIIKKSSA